MSKDYLFSLTITPIQSFISQAKSTKDFYAGSQIISELIKRLLKKFPNQQDIIFPSSEDIVSNKIIARIDIEEQEKLVKKLKPVVNGFLSSYASQNGITKFGEDNLKQLRDVFQLFYSSIKIENSYRSSYLEVEKNLAIIKNLRTFNQMKSKNICYVCGERTSFNSYKDNNKKSRCTICYLKFKDKTKYLSTAGISSLYWRNELATDTKSYEKQFKNFDESLFYEENLNLKYLEKNHQKSTKKEIELFKDELSNLSEDKPTKQYVLINLDGDNIGKILSNGLDNIELEKFHEEFSKKLSAFAKEVKEIIGAEKGRVIYSGGDDFLCFLTPYYLNDVLKEIKESFEKNVNSYQEKISYSIAITIAHYKAPLHKIIESSRALLKATKSKYSSNSSLVKGGIGVEVYSSNSLLAKFIGDYSEFILLKKFDGKKVNLYALEQLFSFAKSDMKYGEYSLVLNMIKVELKRFLARKEIGFSQEEIENIQQLLISQVNKDYSIDLDNFFGFFKTVEQLSKDTNA